MKLTFETGETKLAPLLSLTNPDNEENTQDMKMSVIH